MTRTVSTVDEKLAQATRGVALDALLGSYALGIWLADPSLRLIYSAGRLRSRRTVHELFGSVDPAHPAIAAHLDALSGEGRSFSCQVERTWLEGRVEPLFVDGEITGCVGVVFDESARRMAEQRRDEAQAKLRDTECLAEVGSLEWDVVSDRVEPSPGLLRILGIERPDFDGTRTMLMGFVHPDDRDAVERAVRASIRERSPLLVENRLVQRDGRVRRVLSRGAVQLDERGRVRGVRVSSLDTTARWQTSRELERSASLARSALEATADGILVVDRKGRIGAYSKRFLTMWRIPEEIARAGNDDAALRKAAEQVADAETFLSRVRELYATPEAESFDIVRFVDGRTFERSSLPQRLGDEVVGRVWSFRDVSDRERLLQRTMFLADTSRLLASLDIDRALEAIANLAVPYIGDACAIDLLSEEEGPRRLVSVNRDGAVSLGSEFPRGVISGHSVVYSTGASSRMVVPMQAHGKLLGVLTFRSAVDRRYSKDDRQLVEELGARTALAIESASSYRELQETLHMRDEFLSVAAHELRGPVTSLHLALQGLVTERIPPSDMPKVLDIVAREDRRLVRLVSELLDVVRLRAGRLVFEFETVDLAAITRDAIARLSSEIARAGSKLSMTSESAVVGSWDRTHLDQVVSNLLSNAIKFGAGKPIRVFVSGSKGVARLVVSDEGPGMSLDVQDRIFDPFTRGVPARNFGGLGLGLYVARKIVEGFGGKITVESHPGAGASFSVELPQSRPS